MLVVLLLFYTFTNNINTTTVTTITTKGMKVEFSWNFEVGR